MVLADVFEIRTPDRGDSIRPADPKRAAPVFEDLIDAIARKALSGRVRTELSIAPAEQSAAARAEPETTVRVFVDRPYLLGLESSNWRIGSKSAAAQTRQAAILSNPDIPASVNQQRTHALVRFETAERSRRPAAISPICPDPDTALVIFCKRADVGLGICDRF